MKTQAGRKDLRFKEEEEKLTSPPFPLRLPRPELEALEERISFLGVARNTYIRDLIKADIERSQEAVKGKRKSK